MAETLEEKLLRFETVIGLQMQEIARLREENERLRAGSNAHSVLREIYLDQEAPQGNRIKAAIGALPHETPRLTPQPPPLELAAAESSVPLAELVQQRRARQDRLQAEARNIEVLPSGVVRILPAPNGNGSDQDGD
jgi:hypothetical protein